jgi:hypothetical protein
LPNDFGAQPGESLWDRFRRAELIIHGVKDEYRQLRDLTPSDKGSSLPAT